MSLPPSFIKNIAFQINPLYKLDNSPYSTDEKDIKSTPFIGRTRHKDKFLQFLNGNSKKGVFLVTGYRGMGKTSFVNYVIREYQRLDASGHERKPKQKKHIIPIHLTLAQNKPKEIDILRLLVNSVHDKYLHDRFGTVWRQLKNGALKTKFYGWKLLLTPLLCIIGAVGLLKTSAFCDFVENNKLFGTFPLKPVLLFLERNLVFITVVYVLVFMVLKFLAHLSGKLDTPFNRIKHLMETCYAALSDENSTNEEIYIPYLKTKTTEGEKRTRQFPIAETKQIEYELQEFLSKVKDFEFIFVFDELDKVDPVFSASYLYEDLDTFESKKAGNAYEKDMRERKQAIINIIASLKNFFTTANARFIFIAGREMFDASLADVADRQSSISSIFTYIFNIESLLKETRLKSDNGQHDLNNASLSNAVEAYLKGLLFGEKSEVLLRIVASNEDKQLSLYEMVKAVYFPRERFGHIRSNEYELNCGKIYFTLQNFVTYLTYRSNGSPQKLIKAIHEFIMVKKDFTDEGGKNLVFYHPDRSSVLYLNFDYYNGCILNCRSQNVNFTIKKSMGHGNKRSTSLQANGGQRKDNNR